MRAGTRGRLRLCSAFIPHEPARSSRCRRFLRSLGDQHWRHRHRLDAATVPRSPIAQWQEGLYQRLSKRCHCVVDFWRHLLIVVPDQHLGCDKLAELLNQHLFADACDKALQFAKALGSGTQMVEDHPQRPPAARLRSIPLEEKRYNLELGRSTRTGCQRYETPLPRWRTAHGSLLRQHRGRPPYAKQFR